MQPEAPAVRPERQEGESAKAYAAFCLYRDLGPWRRSVDAAYRAYLQVQGRGENGAPTKTLQPGDRAPSHWENWASTFKWRQRAEAWDADQELALRQDRSREHLKQIEAHRSRAAQGAAALGDVAVRMAGIVNRLLDDTETEMRAADQAKAAGGRARRVAIPKHLTQLGRAAALILSAGTLAEAHALGVEELIAHLDQQE